MSTSDNDSEFDSDASDEEVNLYTQLYFGGNSDVEKENSQLGDSLSQNESLDISNISNEIISKNSKENEIQVQGLNENSQVGSNELNIYVHKSPRRIRNPSICSVESISGREPLDNLYCIDLTIDDPLDTIDEVPDDSKCNDTTENEFQSFCDEPSVNNELANLTDSSSLEDVSILPPPSPKIIPTVLLENENSNSSCSIEIVQCIKRKKSKRNLPKKKKKISKQKVLTISSGSCHSDSDDDNLDVSSVPIIFKLGSSIISTKDKKVKKKAKSSTTVNTKSMVIFSKGRPLTKRTPSCPTWTPDMTSFYDSDYSDEYTVEGIHEHQNSHPRNWKICSEDRQPMRKFQRRFYDVRCTRCKEFGHLVNVCPRVPHCLYCSATDHQYVNQCPKNCCIRCGKPPHGFCLLTSHQRICNECGQFGHDSTLCPDLWRRFHATTSGGVPIIPQNIQEPRRIPSCYNCAKKGHFGHECNMYSNSRDGNFQIRKTFIRVSTDILSYEDPYSQGNKNIREVTLDNELEKVLDSQEENDVKVIEDFKTLKECSSFDVSKTQFPQEQNILLQDIPLTKSQYKIFASKNKFILKEIQKICDPPVEFIRLHKGGDKMTIRGTKKAVLTASDYISMVMFKSPFKKYITFIKGIRKNRLLQKKKKKLEKNIADNELLEEDMKFLQAYNENSSTSKVTSIPQSLKDNVTKKNDKRATEGSFSPQNKSGVGLQAVENSLDSSRTVRTPKRTNKKATLKQEKAIASITKSSNKILSKSKGGDDCSITPKGASSQKENDKEGSSNSVLMNVSKNILTFSDISNDDIFQVIKELPLPFPRCKGDVINALKQATMKFEKAQLQEHIKSVLKFFSKYPRNTVARQKDYLKYIQFLARIVYIQLGKLKGSMVERKLLFFINHLEESEKLTISDKLHNKISNFYWRVANPPFSRLRALLNKCKKFSPTILETDVFNTSKNTISAVSNKDNSFSPSTQEAQSRLYLPVPFPRCTKEAINVLDQFAKRKNIQESKIQEIHRSLEFLKGNKSTLDLSMQSEYFQHIQLLSFNTYFAFKLGKGLSLTRKLNSFKRKIKLCKETEIETELYAQISKAYMEIAYPDYSELEELLKFGEKAVTKARQIEAAKAYAIDYS